MSREERSDAKRKNRDRESHELQRLLSVLSTPLHKQQLPSLPKKLDEKAPTSSPKSKTKSGDKEVDLLQQEWNNRASEDKLLRILSCLRIFIRDPSYQKAFIEMQGLKHFTQKLKATSEQYLEYGEREFTLGILKEMTTFFVVVVIVVESLALEVLVVFVYTIFIAVLVSNFVLIMLLSCTDVSILHSTLYALIGLGQSERPRAVIGELNCVDVLIRIVQDYDIVTKQLAINLLRTLCADVHVREQVKVFDGVPALLSLLDSENIKLLLNVVWILVQLSTDQDTRDEIRHLGGIPLLLSLLQEKNYVMDRNTSNLKSADLTRTPVLPLTEDASLEQRLFLKSAVCAAITELVLNDSNAQHIVAANGVHLLGKMIFPIHTKTAEDSIAAANLQKNAFRALRLLPPILFESFIDVGHYKRDLDAYTSLVENFNSLPESDLEEVREKFDGINQNRAATTFIRQYAVFEHLGSGAFGSVYKVKKQGNQTFLALKEISTVSPAFGKTNKEREKSVGEILNECVIVKEQSQCITFFRIPLFFFDVNDKLYIIMELIDGAPLGEHFNSLKEKGERFSEDRIWNIFTQIVLGLRYIHKEKRIIHRDLTPNNIMLGESDKVTISMSCLLSIANIVA
eukprot:gene13960-4920_t